MDKKIIILSLVFIILGFGVYTKFTDNNKQDKQEKKEIITNEILSKTKKISIFSKKEKTILSLKDDKWVVENRFDWNCDFSKIKRLIDDLKEIKIVHDFKSDDQALKRLELKDPEKNENENTGIKLTFGDESLKPIFSLLKGKRRDKGGQFAIIDDADRISLMEKAMYVDSSPKDWLKKDLISLKDDKARKVTLFNSKDKKIYEISNNKETLTYKVDYPKKFKETVDQDKIKDLFQILEKLETEDVIKEKSDDESFEFRLMYQTEKGLNVEIFIHRLDNHKNLISFKITKKAEEDKTEIAENGEKFIFEISKWDFEKLITDKKELVKKSE